METRYFVMTDQDQQPLTLLRLRIDDKAEAIYEDEWHDGWTESERLYLYITDGDPRLVEITETEARESFPSAFSEATLISKAVDERMFTLGPMYIPNVMDAHNEWTDPDELQKAVWDYVQKGDRRIRLQHDRDKIAGEFVEIMTWPYEVEVPMLMKNATEKKLKFPANTVFLGVVWEPWAWKMVKDGKLRGYSIGGRAERLLADLPDEE